MRKLIKLILKLVTILIALAIIYAAYLFVSSGFDLHAVKSGFMRLFNQAEPYVENIDVDAIKGGVESALDSLGGTIESAVDKIG